MTGGIHRLDPQTQLCHLANTPGIGTRRAYEYTPEETRALEEICRCIGVGMKW